MRGSKVKETAGELRKAMGLVYLPHVAFLGKYDRWRFPCFITEIEMGGMR